MEIIAHRGGSFGKENSLETIIASARMGAYAVECDIRKTSDGVYVIYHDDDLSRLAGVPSKVSSSTYSKMQEYHEKNGLKVLTFEELKNGYKEKTPILLHVKLTDYDMDFAKYVCESGLPIIVGVMSIDMLKCFAAFLPPERILAFLPDYDMAEEFYLNGAGIIRLWEQWLIKVTPSDIKKICPKAKVFIMACNLPFGAKSEDITLETMNGSIPSLEKCKELGADAVLLNDIDMAFEWKKGIK